MQFPFLLRIFAWNYNLFHSNVLSIPNIKDIKEQKNRYMLFQQVLAWTVHWRVETIDAWNLTVLTPNLMHGTHLFLESTDH